MNQKGERFVNENLPYLTDYVAEQEKAWAIVDSADPEKVKVLVDYPDADLAVGADTWEELARKMGVPPEALKRTMDAYNEACETGDDKAEAQGLSETLPQGALLRGARRAADGRNDGRRQGERQVPSRSRRRNAREGPLRGRRSSEPPVLQPRLYLGYGSRHRLHVGSHRGRVRGRRKVSYGRFPPPDGAL